MVMIRWVFVGFCVLYAVFILSEILITIFKG